MGVCSGCGYGIAFIRALNLQNSEPEVRHLDGPIRAKRFADGDSRESVQVCRSKPKCFGNCVSKRERLRIAGLRQFA